MIVYCTGYKVSFPFFDEDFISAPDNDLPLFARTFHPEIDGVYSKRHTMEVDFEAWMRDADRELERGARRVGAAS